jgi:hypothetical protein
MQMDVQQEKVHQWSSDSLSLSSRTEPVKCMHNYKRGIIKLPYMTRECVIPQ